jgi:hypothetical protein
MRSRGTTRCERKGIFMSVARVLNVSGVPGEMRGTGEPPEDARKIVEFTKAQDGCEHVFLLRNTAAGEGLSINVWRDQAALEAAIKRMDDDDVVQAARARLQSQGVTVTPGPVYDFVEL